MTLYQTYAKQLQDWIQRFRETDVLVALYYAIAAADFANEFGISESGDTQETLELAWSTYRTTSFDLAENWDKAQTALDKILSVLQQCDYTGVENTLYSFDEVAPCISEAQDLDGIVNLKTLQVDSRNFIVKAHALAAACLKDRYAAIIPYGFQDDWESVLATYISLNYTGVLTQGVADSKKFYHMCPRESAAQILKQGFRPTLRDSASFGTGVIYTYEDLQKFAGTDLRKYAILEVTYSGPYLKCMWRQDTEKQFLGECMLYPGFISDIRTATPVQRTNLFGSLE